MQALADLRHSEKHDPEEAGFEEECGQHLVGHERADDRSDPLRIHRPVRAELVGHHDAGDHPHAEGHREDFHPILEEIEV